MSSVCGRIVQICWGHSRNEVLNHLEQLGEVVAEVKSWKGRWEYSGAGFVQYRHPESLTASWNYQNCKREWVCPPEQYGVRQNQRGFLMQQYVKDVENGGQKI
eukprot:9575775-Karenia_brevis.AAC.1